MFAKEILNSIQIMKWLKDGIKESPNNVKVVAAEVMVHCLALSKPNLGVNNKIKLKEAVNATMGPAKKDSKEKMLVPLLKEID